MPSLSELLQQAVQLHTAGKLVEAAEIYRTVLQQQPNQPDALHLLGVSEYQQGRSTQAVEWIRRALNVAGQNAQMLGNLGAAYTGLGQNEQALDCYQQAAQLTPRSSDVYYNRGNVLKTLGRRAEAIADFRESLRLRPNYAPALNNLGTAILESGQIDEARQIFEQAVQVDPNYYRAITNLGWIHQKQGRPSDAQACYQRAMQLNPRYAIACNNLASLYFEQNQAEPARIMYEKTLQIDPQMYDAATGLGAVLAQQGKVSEAAEAYRRGLAIRPNDGLRIRVALQTYVVAQNEQEMLDTRRRVEADIEALLARPLRVDDPVQDIGITPFYLSYQGLNEKAFQERLVKLVRHASPSLTFVAPHCRPDVTRSKAGRRPRIGFVSKYFHDHPVGKHYAGMIGAFSRAEFELIVLRLAVPDDAIAREIAGAGDRCLDLDFDLSRARQQISALELDVLVFADVGMDPWTNYLAFARLAPVQCVLGGHPVTTGLDTIDYFISSELMEPADAQEHYSEHLIQLKHLPSFIRRGQLPQQRKTLAELGLDESAHRYVTAQTLFKYHPQDDELFGQILRGDPLGRLYMFCGRHPNWTHMMQQRLQRSLADVYPRISFLPRMIGPEYLQVLDHAHALLDTPRFNGGTTTCDALGIGAPIVTLPGPFQRSRVTLACYRQMRHTELVARDRDDYVRLALRLGNDPAWRAEQREKIRAASTVLFENRAFVDELAEWFRVWGRQPAIEA